MNDLRTFGRREANDRPSKHFSWREFASHSHEGRRTVPVPDHLRAGTRELAANLEVLRAELGDAPITVHSGYRTPEWNEKVGGASRSKHMKATAADITVKGVEPKAVFDAIERLIDEGRMKQGGVGHYKTFVHYDTRGRKARFGDAR